ncbi:MAG: hypothetical protein JWQ11_3429, partial [Rhizobacter sp.]|nr:hypothetical protein [Rhizobacter sp.]
MEAAEGMAAFADAADAADAATRPSLEQWAEGEGLSDWSQLELQALYEERFGVTDAYTRRRQLRNTRLRER